MKKYISALFLALAAATSCIYDDPEQEFELKPGDSVPTFTILMSDGTSMTSAQLSEGAALIMFFHTGCPDCQNTIPSVQKIYDKYKEEVKVILISREQAYEEVQPYWQEKGYTLPYSPQQDRVIYNLFATSRVPRVYVCKDGKVTSCYKDDPIPTYEDLLSDIQAIL